MPKLYYTKTSCAVACFIAAFTAELKIETEQFDLKNHKTSSGADFFLVNPKGNSPTLILDDGTILNESAAVLQYIADLAPGKIAPINGTIDRAVIQNILNYTSSEIHYTYGGLFNSDSEEVKTHCRNTIKKKFQYLNDTFIGSKSFLVGDTFSVADSYLYVNLSWAQYVDIDLSDYPNVKAYFERISALPNVVNALARMETNPRTAF